MSTLFFRALCLIIFIIPLSLIAKPPATASLTNERIFLFTFIDSSSIQTFEGYPKEKAYQDLLTYHFLDCYKNLFAEFKRCEKYGNYDMVEDSSSATVRLRFTIQPYTYKNNVLVFPILIKLSRKTGLNPFTTIIKADARYRVTSKPKSPFHYLDYLLADFRRHFPYKDVVSIFYPHN